MYIHLKDRPHYEDRYDHLTVESARKGMVHYYKFYADFEKKLPENEKVDKPGNAFLLNVFYMETVGNELLRRYEKRDEVINDWMANDEAKDTQITNARLAEEPHCHHCRGKGLRIVDKSLMHRHKDAQYDDPEDVLFMLSCPSCDKNSAFWEDGAAWEPKPTLCPKCSTEMTHKTTKTKKAIIFTYSCPSCKHFFKDKIELADKKEEIDPDYEKDRVHYCLLDKELHDRLFKMRHDFIEMAKLGKEFKERNDNKHLYDAVKEIKKPKIAELITLLSEPLEKSGYTEFHLDKPEMGRDVFIGFSCLDSRPDRSDNDSRKSLKELVDNILKDTNWRLMSDGIAYRLGYLNGRLRAYEREEDLIAIVKKTKPN